MARRGMKFCIICNPFDNGMDGDEGTEAVAKYYLPYPGEEGYSEEQLNHGWIPCCRECVNLCSTNYVVEYLSGKKAILEPIIDIYSGPFGHDWHKVNLMTREDGTDLWKCAKCDGEFIKKTLYDTYPTSGCKVK